MVRQQARAARTDVGRYRHMRRRRWAAASAAHQRHADDYSEHVSGKFVSEG